MLISKTPSIQLHPQDCLIGMREMSPGSVDIVVTSPPYNIGVKYRRYDDSIPRQKYLQWMAEWGKEIKRVLKETGSLFLNVGSKPTSPELPFQVLNALLPEFRLQNTIHWVKSIYIESESYGRKFDINVGHYKPINSPRFLNDAHEYIFHLTISGDIRLDRLALGVPYKDKSNIGRWKNGDRKVRCRGNCWFIPYETIQSRNNDRPHPASFPVQLAENCIRLHGTKKDLLVLDPFAGIGNTALACQKLKVNFIGFEIDPYYLKTAAKRLKAAADKPLDKR